MTGATCTCETKAAPSIRQLVSIKVACRRKKILPSQATKRAIYKGGVWPVRPEHVPRARALGAHTMPACHHIATCRHSWICNSLRSCTNRIPKIKLNKDDNKDGNDNNDNKLIKLGIFEDDIY